MLLRNQKGLGTAAEHAWTGLPSRRRLWNKFGAVCRANRDQGGSVVMGTGLRWYKMTTSVIWNCFFAIVITVVVGVLVLLCATPIRTPAIVLAGDPPAAWLYVEPGVTNLITPDGNRSFSARWRSICEMEISGDSQLCNLPHIREITLVRPHRL